ncbi:MAG: hypothetical protein ACREMO_02615 [Gemmatimonadales bacterium]
MSQVTLQDLRRVADSLAQLKGRAVHDASIRSDFRQLKLELSDGLILVVALETDETGRPHLEVDLVRQPEDRSRQLEVRFEEI